ncbi:MULTISPECIES: ABC transporter substrate-binding protein [unclassified Methylophaga]|jgi:ABC-type nitrate/sulfonate/bicarbonate transport system substrate-binding protein|uniref:ABC transporter substrate-binding protein n=1 Tax=unclassified Methylophaga TaxID=2629249 RepID=UPI0025EAD7B7|nr:MULTISPECIES: ABC transporter substrate-binding protein [unclassified Methylophaga]|tara:strand:+ start:1634 stop:2650 length:1017 start_codon:yes stop_codon:yes gene_type:complete
MGLKRVLILFVLFSVACSSENTDIPSLKLAGVNYLGDLPTLVASKNELFKKYQLDVDVSFNNSGRQSLDDLRAGKVDFALVSPTAFTLDKLANANNELQNDEPVILGNLLHSTLMNQILTTTNGKQIQTVTDLSGGRIGLPKGTNSEYIWWVYSVFYQVNTDQVDIIDLPISELGKALIDDKVDAIVTWQPWTNHFIAEYGDQLKQVEGSHVYSAKWLLVTTRKITEQNPQNCQQLLRAYADAISLIHSDTDNVMQMYSQEMSENAILGQNYQPGLHQLNLNWSLISELHQNIQWAKLNNFPGSEKPINVTSWFAPEPLKAIQPFLVKIPTLQTEENQ